jgi:hypothetical protein
MLMGWVGLGLMVSNRFMGSPDGELLLLRHVRSLSSPVMHNLSWSLASGNAAVAPGHNRTSTADDVWLDANVVPVRREGKGLPSMASEHADHEDYTMVQRRSRLLKPQLDTSVKKIPVSLLFIVSNKKFGDGFCLPEKASAMTG